MKTKARKARNSCTKKWASFLRPQLCQPPASPVRNQQHEYGEYDAKVRLVSRRASSSNITCHAVDMGWNLEAPSTEDSPALC
jgi:hypothetical protein